MRTRNPDLEARWREGVDAWHSSGLTAAQFAAQNGFSTSALTGWSSKLRHRQLSFACEKSGERTVRRG